MDGFLLQHKLTIKKLTKIVNKVNKLTIYNLIMNIHTMFIKKSFSVSFCCKKMLAKIY